MCQLLIVDDELIAVEGLKSGVQWEAIGISKVFTAHSAEQAKTVFGQERIDILLCDIEMPQATGLELLEWVRLHYPRTETIFLTCHADFGYAKQAIQLGSLDYLLKPIPYPDLEETIKRAIRKLDQDNRNSEFSQYGKYWVQYQPLLVERFWLDILNQTIPGDAEAIRKAAEERNIPYTNEMRFLPVLIHVRRWHKKITLRDEKIMEYAIRKSAEELLLNELERGLLISLGDGFMLAMFNLESQGTVNEKLRAGCEQWIEACRTYFFAGVSCYIGETAHPDQLAYMFLRLRKLDENNVAHDQGVFSLKDPQTLSPEGMPPDIGMWSILLKEGAREPLLRALEDYMEEQVASGGLDFDRLNQLIQDFQQMVYYVLQVKGIQAHQLFGDNDSITLHAAAARTSTDALSWMRHIVDKSIQFDAALDHTQSVTDKAKAYIHEHLAEDISRDDIASHVYLNPDYLTRIFKKETGMSVSDYVLQQRLTLAAGLLAQSELPVSAIASKVGYANFSHFSRMFKKYLSLSPLEYRSRHQAASAPTASRESDSGKS